MYHGSVFLMIVSGSVFSLGGWDQGILNPGPQPCTHLPWYSLISAIKRDELNHKTSIFEDNFGQYLLDTLFVRAPLQCGWAPRTAPSTSTTAQITSGTLKGTLDQVEMKCRKSTSPTIFFVIRLFSVQVSAVIFIYFI